MNITPTSLKKANTMATRIAVYDADIQKPVLLFKSIYFCVEHLFPQFIKSAQIYKGYYIIQKLCIVKRQTETENIFKANFTYRLVNDEQKNLLGSKDVVVLYDKYKINTAPPTAKVYKPYALEKVLEVGDIVSILYGRLADYTTSVLAVKDKLQNTPGTKLYTLDINGEQKDFKANVLKLIEKNIFSTSELLQ